MTIKVGFIGVGGMGMGQAHAFAKVSSATVAAASDLSEKSLANFAKAFPKAKTYKTHADLLADKTIDAVVVCTPTLLHKDVCIDAMKSGRAVLTEKPMARTVADCQRMIEASEKTGKLLMVAHCRRFDTDWGCWGKIVKSGAVGTPAIFRNVSAGNFLLYSQSSWFLDDKLGGGPLIDGAVHNYDFGVHVFGEPDSVVASSIKLKPSVTAVDTGTAVVRFKSGDQLMVSWSWAVNGQNAIDVLGPKGSITWGPGDLATPELDVKNFGYYRWVDPMNKKKKLYKFKRTDMYVTQAKHFIDCINGKTKCLTPGTEAIKAVAIAEAILKASPSGKALKVSW
ncbi:MAG: Gfo/Idh/MocA family oxidoreductase [Planctomycetes bacterium]|nr:Gfo/Idh/MocA family oxidoreductase [Planctomycetota bacterium]